MKLRLPGRRDAAAPTTDPSDDLTTQLVKAGGKGRPTPKRNEAQGRRPGPPPPPPTSRKEAYRRQRQTQAANRGTPRAGAARGEDMLPKRDQGPVRKLVRDIVDSRRNVASIFLFVAVLMLVAQFTPSLMVKTYTFAAWTGLFLLIVLDSFVLSRKIRKAIAEQYPKAGGKGHVWYGISRSTMIRRWRFPKADPALTQRS